MVDARPITPTSRNSPGTLIRSRSTVTAQYMSFDAKRAMAEQVTNKDFTEISSLPVCGRTCNKCHGHANLRRRPFCCAARGLIDEYYHQHAGKEISFLR